MLVGILVGDSLAEFTKMIGASPIQIVNPPVVYLNRPGFVLPEASSKAINGQDLRIRMRAVVFKHLYNTATSITTFCAATAFEDRTHSLRKLYSNIGVDPSLSVGFQPYFVLAEDGMRSYATRAFLRSLSGSLPSVSLEFSLMSMSKDDEGYFTLEQNFNPECSSEFQGVDAIADSILP